MNIINAISGTNDRKHHLPLILISWSLFTVIYKNAASVIMTVKQFNNVEFSTSLNKKPKNEKIVNTTRYPRNFNLEYLSVSVYKLEFLSLLKYAMIKKILGTMNIAIISMDHGEIPLNINYRITLYT